MLCGNKILLESAYLWAFVDMFQWSLLLEFMCES